jgi:hypothetical protein
METDPTNFALARMQTIGVLYAIFISISILAFQNVLTAKENFTKEVIKTVSDFKHVFVVLTYMVLFVELWCLALIYSTIGRSLVLFFSYAVFILVIVAIMAFSYYLICVLMSPITNENAGFNFEELKRISKHEFMDVALAFICVFMFVGVYHFLGNIIISGISGIVIFIISIKGKNKDMKAIEAPGNKKKWYKFW